MTNILSPADAESERAARAWGGILSLWRLCDNVACRRARACRGTARVCFRRRFGLLPLGVQTWFLEHCDAGKRKLPFDQVCEGLRATPAGEAFREWNEAANASAARPATRPSPCRRATSG